MTKDQAASRWPYIISQIIFLIIILSCWLLAERRADYNREQYEWALTKVGQCIHVAEDNQHAAEKAIALLKECKEGAP